MTSEHIVNSSLSNMEKKTYRILRYPVTGLKSEGIAHRKLNRSLGIVFFPTLLHDTLHNNFCFYQDFEGDVYITIKLVGT